MILSKPGPLCGQCPLKDAPGPVYGSGSSNAKLLIVGMCPGPEEIQHGQPFVGKSGYVLDRNLTQAGSDRSRTFTTNVVKCFVQPGRPLDPKAVSCCAPLIQQELDSIPYTTILTLGQEAFHAFTHKKLVLQSPLRKRSPLTGKIRDPDSNVWLRGAVYTISRLARRALVPTMHPAFLLRTGFAGLPFFARDIQKAVRFAAGGGVWYDETYEYSPTSGQVSEYVQDILRTGHFGGDIETSEEVDDEEERDARAGDKVQVIGLSKAIGECIGVPPDLFSLLKPLFADRHREPPLAYFYNWGFDGWYLHKLFGELIGVKPFDVMKGFILSYSDSQRKDLGTALSWYTDMPYTKNLAKTNPDRYNATDTYGVLWAGLECTKELRSI